MILGPKDFLEEISGKYFSKSSKVIQVGIKESNELINYKNSNKTDSNFFGCDEQCSNLS